MEKALETRYFTDENGTVHRVQVFSDPEPVNPREEFDGNIGHMMVWWNRYNLGDKNEWSDKGPECFLNDIVRERVPENSIINYVKAGKANIRLEYQRSDRSWYLYEREKGAYISDDHEASNLVDDIVESLSFKDKLCLLEKHGDAAIQPLYIYEHGGVTINTCGFTDPWDSGQAGWIWTDKETVLKNIGSFIDENCKRNKVTKKNWRKAARYWLEEEVKEYDMYLQGECYGFVESVKKNDEWIRENSVWGIFSNKWGNALVEEVFEALPGTLREEIPA